MARVRKFKPTKKKTYMQSFADIITDALLGEEEKSPAEINAAALSVSGENISDINLKKYNEGGLRDQNEAIVPYVIETPFNATFDSAKAFDFSDKSRHIAEGFLAAYKGNGLAEADSALANGNFIAKDGALGKQGVLGRFGVTADYGLEPIYGAHDSDPAKRMRTELAAKLDTFEAELAENISNRTESHDAMKAKKDAFMREIGVFFNECDKEIFHRGVGMSTRDEERSIIGDLWHNRYDYEAYYERVNDHLTAKIEASQQLNQQFHLWQGAVEVAVPPTPNAALTKFLKENKPLTAEDVGKRFEGDLAALKKAYDRDAFTLVTRLDNNPSQISAAKKLKADYQAKFAQCIDHYATYGINAQVQPTATVTTSLGGSLAHTGATTATANVSLTKHLFGSSTDKGRLAEIDTAIRAQAVTKITTFEEAKSRLQQWRYEYDRDNSARYDKVLDKATTFSQSAEAALKAIEALEPKDTGAAPAPTLGETFEGTISDRHGYEDQLTALETAIKTKIKAGETVDLAALSATLPPELAVNVDAKAALDKITAAYTPAAATPLAKLEASYKAYGSEPVSAKELADLDQRVQAIRAELVTLKDAVLPDEPTDDKASNYVETKLAYDTALEAQKAAIADLATLAGLEQTFKAVRETELTTKIQELHLSCKGFAAKDPKVPAELALIKAEILALRTNFADRPLCPTPPLEPAALPTTPEPTAAERQAHVEATALYDTAKAAYDKDKLDYDTARLAYDSANPLAAKLDAIEAYYLPPDVTKLDSSIAEHAKSFASLKLDLVDLQDEFAKETRALLKIEFLCDRLQAEHDLNVLKVEYEAKFKGLTDELTALNKSVQELKEDNLNAALVADKQVFATQVAALVAAQQKALTETLDFAAQDRAQSTKDFQDYDLKYHLFLLKHGSDAAPTAAELAKYDPRAELKALSDDPLLDDRMDFGLMAVSKRPGKAGPPTEYEIHLHSGSSLGKAENISTDEEWAGTPTWGYLISHFMNRESRSAEIRDTLTNPEKLDGVGRALQMILDDKMQTPGAKRELSCKYDAYTPDNWNSMLAQHFAAIPLGIEMDPGVSFDKSFKGEKYGKYEITHTMPKAIRAEKRAEFIRLVEERKAAYQLSGQFNGACRALLVNGALEPKKMVDLKPAQKAFLSALNDNVHRDPSKPYDANVAVTRIEALSFKNIKGLMADGGAMNGRAASMLGDVLEKDFAVQVLARKEREITALMHFADGSGNKGLVAKAVQLQQQLHQDYAHVANLASKQGIGSRSSITAQSAAVLSGLNATAAARDLDVREKIVEIELKARGKAAESKIETILATPIPTDTKSKGFSAVLKDLATALDAMASGHEMSKKPEAAPIEQFLKNGAALRDWDQFNAMDLDGQLATYKSLQEPKIEDLKSEIAILEKDSRVVAKHQAAEAKVDTLVAAHQKLENAHEALVADHKALVVEYKALVAEHAALAAEVQPDQLKLQHLAIEIAKIADAINLKVNGVAAELDPTTGKVIKAPIKGHEDLAREIEQSTIAITDAKKTLAALPLEQKNQDLKAATAELAAVEKAHDFLRDLKAPINTAIAEFDAAFAAQKQTFAAITAPDNISKPDTFYADSSKAFEQLAVLKDEFETLAEMVILPAQVTRLQNFINEVKTAQDRLSNMLVRELASNRVPEESEIQAARDAIEQSVLPAVSKIQNALRCDALEQMYDQAKDGITQTTGALDAVGTGVLLMNVYAGAKADLDLLKALKADIEHLAAKGEGTPAQQEQIKALLTGVTERISDRMENAKVATRDLIAAPDRDPQRKIAALEEAIAFHKAYPETEPKPSSANVGRFRLLAPASAPDEPLVAACKQEIFELKAGIVAAHAQAHDGLELTEFSSESSSSRSSYSSDDSDSSSNDSSSQDPNEENSDNEEGLGASRRSSFH